MLLDAGEGTWQQMVRMSQSTPSIVLPDPIVDINTKYENDPGLSMPHQNNGISIKNNGISSHSSEEILARNLKVIWISHPHADHHLGLLMILSERKRLMMSGKKKEFHEKNKKLLQNIYYKNFNDGEYLKALKVLMAFMRH